MSTSSEVALLVIDVQTGLFTRSIPIHKANKLIENIRLLIDRAHRVGASVFFIQHSNEKILPEGSEEWRFHPKLQPLEIDQVIAKRHGSAFEQTTLEQELGERHIRQLIVTGLVTQGCVRATCLDAQKLGYKLVLVKDGHSTYHRQALKVIEEWNDKLSQAGITLKSANEVDFQQLMAA